MNNSLVKFIKATRVVTKFLQMFFSNMQLGPLPNLFIYENHRYIGVKYISYRLSCVKYSNVVDI